MLASVVWLTFLSGIAVAYEHNITMKALYYAYGTYCDSADIASWNCRWCERNPHFEISAADAVITSNALQAYIGFDASLQKIVLSLRGSSFSEIPNLVYDLDVVRREYPYAEGNVHNDFYLSYRSLMQAGLAAAMQRILTQYPNSDVLVCGHSIGGALAQIAALEFKANDAWSAYKIGAVQVVTFGAPRCFCKDLAAAYNELVDVHWRIVYQKDVVPVVPYQDFGFHHSATKIYYEDENEFYICDGSGEDPHCKYFGYSIMNHLYYFGLYGGCTDEEPFTTSAFGSWTEEPFGSWTAAADVVATTKFISNSSDDMMSTEMMSELDIENVVYKWKVEMDKASQIGCILFAASGCVMTCICAGLLLKVKMDIQKAKNTPYYQMY